jgi:hypothetical protein
MANSAGADTGLQLIATDKRGPTRSRQPKRFVVEVVKFKDALPNKENPYARFSTIERYEIVIKYLAELWAAISKRNANEASISTERKRAAA